MSKQQLFVVGYPRSGNVWLARLLGRILDCEIASGKPKPSLADEGAGRNGKYIIRQRHSRKPVDGKVIFIYRDPRDVAVSAMHYWHYESLTDMFTSNRKAIKVLTNDNVGGWANFMRLWLEDRGVDALATYEGLHRNAFVELREVVDLLDHEDIPDKKITDAIEKEQFAHRRKRIETEDRDKFPYGRNIQLNHMRKGIVGDWRNHFTRETAEQVHEHWWYWLQKLGYENDENWWKELDNGQ